MSRSALALAGTRGRCGEIVREFEYSFSKLVKYLLVVQESPTTPAGPSLFEESRMAQRR